MDKGAMVVMKSWIFLLYLCLCCCVSIAFSLSLSLSLSLSFSLSLSLPLSFSLSLSLFLPNTDLAELPVLSSKKGDELGLPMYRGKFSFDGIQSSLYVGEPLLVSWLQKEIFHSGKLFFHTMKCQLHRQECPEITYMAMGFRPHSFPVGGMYVKGIGRFTKVKENHSLLFSIASLTYPLKSASQILRVYLSGKEKPVVEAQH